MIKGSLLPFLLSENYELLFKRRYIDCKGVNYEPTCR